MSEEAIRNGPGGNADSGESGRIRRPDNEPPDSGAANSSNSGRNDEQGQDSERTIAEWVTLAVSTAIVLLLVGFILYQQFTGGNDPATIEVRPMLQQVRQEGDLYYLPLELFNSGDLPAEDVLVELSLDSGGEEPETAQLAVLFLNGGAKAQGVLVFQSDPNEGELTVSSLSFLEP